MDVPTQWCDTGACMDGHAGRESFKRLKQDFDKSEDDLKALQSVGQILGEVLKQLGPDTCTCVFVFVYI